MTRLIITRLMLLMLTASLLMPSCRDDSWSTDPDLDVTFSLDSLLFDTVFTSLGSSTRAFKVYNTHSRRIRISSVSLAGGEGSFFRINVNGISARTVRDVEIGARDSIFVFVEVTVDPVNQNLPLVIADSIVFNTNGNIRDVKLVAWGQDARFIHPNYQDPGSGLRYHLITSDQHWDDSLPYVVYGLAVVAPDVTLSMGPGTRVHMHNNASLVFLAGASLKAEGNRDRPVVIQGDRLEPFYRDKPGQWGRIWFTATSKDHVIDHTIIKNGTVGLHTDTIGSLTAPTLTIRNSQILNMQIAGLLAQGSHVVGENLLIANSGERSMILALGGTYDFRHCTFVNYYSLGSRRHPSILLNNYYEDDQGRVQIRNFNKIFFGNTIIYGSMAEEIAWDFFPGTNPSFVFDHCLIRSGRPVSEAFIQPVMNLSPLFLDVSKNDYRLTELSPAIGRGNPDIAAGIPLDLMGRDRIARPDIGAIQFYPIGPDN